MTEYLMFQAAFLGSLENAKEPYEQARKIDLVNDGEDFSFDHLYEMVAKYIISPERKKKVGLETLPMPEFVESLLELAFEKDIPAPEIMLGENYNNPVKDFAKKTFLIIIATSILQKI